MNIQDMTATTKAFEAVMASTPLLAGFFHIEDEAHYHAALELVEMLMEQAEDREGEPLLVYIEALSQAIATYENHAEQFSAFNQALKSVSNDAAILRTLMDQYELKISDFKNEIGGKSMVSMILNGHRSLTRTHIAKLKERFGISPAFFY